MTGRRRAGATAGLRWRAAAALVLAAAALLRCGRDRRLLTLVVRHDRVAGRRRQPHHPVRPPGPGLPAGAPRRACADREPWQHPGHQAGRRPGSQLRRAHLRRRQPRVAHDGGRKHARPRTGTPSLPPTAWCWPTRRAAGTRSSLPRATGSARSPPRACSSAWPTRASTPPATGPSWCWTWRSATTTTTTSSPMSRSAASRRPSP